MNRSPDNPLVPWQDIDSILLDMDGTLVDLNYDNRVFGHLFPAAYAQQHHLNEESAQIKLREHMVSVLGTMNFYRLDYWRDFAGVDMVALHQQASELIRFLPGVESFLQRLGQTKKQVMIVTNADRQSFNIKDQRLQLATRVNGVISSHDYGVPKEDPAFWRILVEQTHIDPARALFIDDTPRVLDAARRFGIGHILAVRIADTEAPPKNTEGYASFDHYDQLLPGAP